MTSAKACLLALALSVGLTSNSLGAQTTPPVVTQPISISDAVAIALKNSPKIASQSYMAAAAEARAGMARSMTRPTITTTTFATTGTMPMIVSGAPGVDPQPVISTPDTRQFDQNLMAMYPIYTGGRLNAQWRAARSLSQSAKADAAAMSLDVALDAKTAYRAALLASKFVEAYQTRVDESKERLRIAEIAFQEGKIAKYDLLRNQTELAESQQTLINAQRDVDMALIDLKTVLGVSLDSHFTLTDQLTIQPAQGDLVDFTGRALKQRPEVSAAQARVASAKAGVSAAKGAYSPQVYAVAMQDFVSVSGNGSDNGYTVGVTAGFPILDGGQRRSATKEATAMKQQAEADQRSIELQINKEVGSAWVQAQAAAKTVDLAKAAVDQADEDYRVIKLRYEAGKAINVEVLDALASLTRAQTNYAQAIYEQNVALDKLHRAVGDNQ
jgi:outer membrane protein